MIRVATYLDIPPLLMLLSDMHKECPLAYGETSWAKIVRKVTDAIDQGIVFVAEVDGELVGSIGGMVGSEWFTDAKSLGDLWFYVRVDKRESSAAFKLLKEFRDFGRKNSLSIRVGHVFGLNVDQLDKLYERLEFKKSGSFFTEGI